MGGRMRGVLAWLAVLSTIPAAGCHPTFPEPTREQVLSARVRTFPVATTDDVLVAAERVLAAQRPDFKFLYEPNQTMAIDSGAGLVWPWSVKWKVATEQKGADVRAVASVSVETTQGVTDPTAPPAYRMFFDRVEYVLGRRAKWPSCRDAESAPGYDSRDNQVSVMAICGISDEAPERLKSQEAGRP